MRFINKTLLLLLSAALASFAGENGQNAQTKELPLLKAKQSLENIRFISKDGKYTYYQRRSGDLQLSTNYSNEQVLDGKKLTEYLVFSSPARKKLIFAKDESFHSDMSFYKPMKLYIAPYGGAKPVFAGQGTSPKLHLEDSFISYYRPKSRTVKIKSLASDKERSVKLLNPINPYFTPQVFMPVPNEVIYSDLNEDGREAFLARSLLNGEAKTVFKSAYPGNKLEACLTDDSLYVGEFERGDGKGGSKILKIPLYGNPNYEKFEILYQSSGADIGNMVCVPDKIYFIKTTAYDKDLNLKKTEAALLDLDKKRTQIMTDLKRVSQLVDMDGMILVPRLGSYRVLEGAADATDDSINRSKR